MSIYNAPNHDLSIFNYANYNYSTFASIGDLSNYLPLVGGTMSGTLYGTTINMSSSITGSSLIAPSLSLTGGSPSISATGPLSLNNSFSATGLSTPSLTLSGSNPIFNLSQPCNINNSLVWTGGIQPTLTNGIGIRYIPGSSIGLIRSYNYILSQYNNRHSMKS